MPSGRTHDRITLWGLPGIVLGSFWLTRNGGLTLLVAAGYLFSGLMFGPDLDIHSIQFKRWGILRWIWIPYQKTLNHRSPLSHGPIIGTILRILYLSLILLTIAIISITIAQSLLGFTWNWQDFAQQSRQQLTQQYWPQAIALFLGLETGAMSHSLSDLIGSALKKYQKKGLAAFFAPKRKTRRRQPRKK